MAEYIERKAAIEKITDYCKLRQAICENSEDEFLRGLKTALKAITYNDVIPTADVQPVDTKEILRHLDSLMICVCNAYNTSHYLLESDMEFIEKQEKIIKGLLSNEAIKG